MEGFTTFPMRVWLNLAARPAAMTTPFLRVTRTHPDGRLPLLFAPELFELQGALPYELTPQLITGNVGLFVQTAQLFPPEVAPVIELNCGCPSPNSVGKHAGSGILRDPNAFGASIAALVAALGPRRLAVKMRLGVSDSSEFGPLLQHIAALSLARLTVHGRTRVDRYRGAARWDLIQHAASVACMPTWASGDICGLDTATQIQSTAPSIAGAVIGRGLLRNPWVFEELRLGAYQQLTIPTLANALLCYALLNELCMTSPAKLIAKVARGHFVGFCGTSASNWESVTAELSTMIGGYPFTLNGRSSHSSLADLKISPTTFARLRMLWSYLRTSLPSQFFAPMLMRARSCSEFFGQLFALSEEAGISQMPVVLRHQPAWDDLFGGARGTNI